ncbi:hypothetical protein [Streptomyces lydicamycinicus]|uniref:hypothetical protein n=1 Tax=Streptomyces lydicamycinicus TaxID=1546107 RepID=UPI003C2EF97C
MGLFSRKASTEQIMRDEAKAADMCKENADKVAATGKPIYGISEDGWNARAENFQAEANRLKNQLARKRR